MTMPDTETSGIEILSSTNSENGIDCKSGHEVQPEHLDKVGGTLLGSTQTACSEQISWSPKKDPKDISMAKDCFNKSQSHADQEKTEANTARKLSYASHSRLPIDVASTESRSIGSDTLRECSGSPIGFIEAPNGMISNERPFSVSGQQDLPPNPTLLEVNMAPDTSFHSSTANYAANSDHVVMPKAIYLKEDCVDHGKETVGPLSSMGTCDALHFAESSEDQLPIHEIDAARVVSTNLEGWQRFDADERELNAASGFKQSIDGATQKNLELWEQLLEDDGPEDSAKLTPMTAALEKADSILESSLPDGNEFWFASPSNPFVEGLARSSNFSDADDFIPNSNGERSLSLHTQVVDELANKERILSDTICKDSYSDALNNDSRPAGSQFDGIQTNGSKKVVQQRFPSFSDLRRSSSRPRENSYPSFREQELNDSMGFENGGEKWEAIFDSGAPAINEGPRSLSLPREASESDNYGSFEDINTAHSKLSGFLASPKLSPLVKRVTSKVRTNQSQAKDTIHEGKPSKRLEKKGSRKLPWRCCICCSSES